MPDFDTVWQAIISAKKIRAKFIVILTNFTFSNLCFISENIAQIFMHFLPSNMDYLRIKFKVKSM